MGQEGPSVRVVIGADAALLREGLVRCLDDAGGVEVVASVGDLGHLASYVRGHDADVLLLAPSPDRAGDPELVATVVEGLRAAGSNAPVVVLGLSADLTGTTLAKRIVDTFMRTAFEGGRHERRIRKIRDIEDGRAPGK